MEPRLADGRGAGKRGERIAQTAARYRVSVATLRLYEQQGILPPASRSNGGHRRYSDADMEWIDTVMLLRDTGMTVAQMSEIAGLARSGRSGAAEALIQEHAARALTRATELSRQARLLKSWSVSMAVDDRGDPLDSTR